jgi:hypothetical protein
MPAHFSKAVAEDDCPLSADLAEFLKLLNRCFRVNGKNADIRYFRQITQTAIAPHPLSGF